tara:strand:- start:22966 stop:23415 length:450 start_codon:yes stop_codon:yes gene_type:complete
MSEEIGQKPINNPEQLILFEEEEVTTNNRSSRRLCNKCNGWLPISAFGNASGGNYLRRECKQCNKELKKVRDKLRLEHEAPPKEYTCPICLGTEKEVEGMGGHSSGTWVLDHCHEKKSFRGWLCHKCNRALGGFNDNKNYLKRAIEYLG